MRCGTVIVALSTLFVVVVGVSEAAAAQIVIPTQTPYYRPYGWGPWGGAYPGYGTVAGSYAAGMGSLIRSQGAYNQMTAQAAISAQQAKSLALDNRLKAAQTQYQLQRMNQANRAEQERIRLANRVDYTPPPAPRPTAEQLDPVTGRITWPEVLMADDYGADRAKLDLLFAQRARSPASASFAQISGAALSMRNKLDGNFDRLSQGDFFAARHFIDALVEEARHSGLDAAQASAAN